MNKTVFGVLTFAVGAVIGSAVTWKFLKTKYEQITQEEIDSVKEYYNQKYGINSDSKPKTEDDQSEDEEEDQIDIYELKDYLTKIRESGYGTGVNNTPVEESVREGGVTMVDRLCVIPPIEFGEIDEYEQHTLFYHADGVLADDYGNPIVDMMSLIGVNPADHFGEYERDSVYVRNDYIKAYFEILRDESKSTEIKRLDYCLTDTEDDG